ncbi:ANR family transcriptional regulator [Serratia marcescens]|uniref:ANR family transcriptional regulator n=1 Tax=Serratia marcescens TaxID=615 RepID=UPI001BAEFBDC|nr:ANR family transcriptional regulator [Serratia marcescens]
MKKSPYSAAAQQAIQHEHAEEFDLASTFWRRAETVAMKPVNQQWASTRAEMCEKRHGLEERRALLQESASERAKEAAKTKAKKKMAEALEAHIKTTSEEA